MPNEIIDAELGTTPPQRPAQPTKTQAEGRQLRRGPVLSWLHRTFRDLWFYVAAVALIVNLVHTFRPQLSVQIGATIPNQPASTLFTLTNTGSWTLYNITTTCSIWTGRRWIISEGNVVAPNPNAAMAGNPDIRSLAPLDIATQDCAMAMITRIPANESIRININSKFIWFFGNGHAGRHFDVRNIGGVLILVPDVESRPDLPAPPSS
jgi:hypothetical protein